MSPSGCVTASIGVAAMVPGKGEAPETLVKGADDALFRAKEQGHQADLHGMKLYDPKRPIKPVMFNFSPLCPQPLISMTFSN